MHKGVILLVAADDRNQAEEKANEFLQGYEEQVWDWYVIGGRWTGTLTGYDPTKDERNIEVCRLCSGTGDRKDLELPDWKKECNGCNGTGKCVKFSFIEVDDNVQPLTNEHTKKVVQGWAKDWEKVRLAEVEKTKADFKGDKMMQAYALRLESHIVGDEFSFESNVYNINKNTNSLPESFDGYWAVMVDMHN